MHPAEPTPSPSPRQSPRAFVILVVLAVAAAIAAVVAGQLISGQKAEMVGIRASEEVQARGLAEACLSLMSAYATNFQPAPTSGDDFDALLAGPDLVAGTADDYLPFGTGRFVTIPEAAATLAGDELNRHHWNLVTMPGSTGVCAIRLDDNSDDGRAPFPGVAPEPGESCCATGCGMVPPCVGPEVLNKDSDRSIYITAIGLFPATAADAQLYEKAHARVTLRRVLQLPNMVQPRQPGVWANNIDIGDNGAMCGLGGLEANSIAMKNNTCACGQLLSDDVPPVSGGKGKTPGETCTACPDPPGCVPAAPTTGVPRTPPTWIHWANVVDDGDDDAPTVAFRDNEGWGPASRVADPLNPMPPGVDGENLAPDPVTVNSIVGGADPAPFCAFYGDIATQRLFVWDGGDSNTQETLQSILQGVAMPGVPLLDTNADNVGDANLPADNCTAGGALHNASPIKKPCTWRTNGVNQTALSCAADETPCWKLVGILAGVAGVPLGLNNYAGAESEWTLPGGGGEEEWHPKANTPIPNVRPLPGPVNRVFGGYANRLCGSAANNCSSCRTAAGVGNAEFAVEKATGGGGDHFHWEDGANDAYSPSPSLWLIDHSAGNRAHLKDVGGGGGTPWRATVLVAGQLEYEDGDMCCATCDCTGFAGLGSFRIDPAWGAVDPAAVTIKANNPNIGFAIKATGDVDFRNNTRVVGDVRAQSIWYKSNNSQLGATVSYGTGAAGDCGGGTCSPAHICFDNNGTFAGDIHSMSSIRGDNNAEIDGNIVAKMSVCLHNNSDIAGNILAGGTVELGNNARVAATAVDIAAAPVAINSQVTTYLEAMW